jgi:hypothetical protein
MNEVRKGATSITWGQRTFGDLELGDARRSRRLPELVDAMCKHPGGTLPDKLSEPAELRAFYRMMDAYETGASRHFVLRSRENRKLVQPINDQWYLYEAVRTRQAVLAWEQEISARRGGQARKAQLKMSFAAVTLDVPSKRAGEYPDEPLAMWTVRVWEPHPPAGAEALEWILLTNVAVTTPDEARDRVRWYECRFVIEEYHKGLKTGCGIEQLQFIHIGRLEPAIGILSALTTTLLQLRDAARAPDADTLPATAVVNAEYVEVLVQRYPQRLRGHISVKAFYMHVARLGGHQNRKSDGFPGWLTL